MLKSILVSVYTKKPPLESSQKIIRKKVISVCGTLFEQLFELNCKAKFCEYELFHANLPF